MQGEDGIHFPAAGDGWGGKRGFGGGHALDSEAEGGGRGGGVGEEVLGDEGVEMVFWGGPRREGGKLVTFFFFFEGKFEWEWGMVFTIFHSAVSHSSTFFDQHSYSARIAPVLGM